MQNDYIYILTHVCAFMGNNEHMQKIGSTRNLLSRFASYRTYYPIAININKLYKINQNCYLVDNLIKNKFSEYNIYINSGIEYYSLKLTTKMIEDFFRELNIQFEEVDISSIKYENINLSKLDKFYLAEEDEQIELTKNINVNIRKPKDYQIEIINKVYDHFINNKNNKGTIIMACGTGKSLTAYWICKKLNCKKILVLVPSLYLLDQLGKNFIDQAIMEHRNVNLCFVGSDLNIPNYEPISKQEKDKIKNFIEKNDNFIMFSTYQSCDALKDFVFDLMIFDEAHKTATIPKINMNAIDENDKLTYSGFNIMITQYNINPNVMKLFMTATEKICSDKPKDDDIEVISMDNENLYGKILHHLSIRDAIKLKALSDYKIIVHREDIDNVVTQDVINNILRNVNFKNNKQYYAKAIILKRSTEKYGITHIITKHSTCQNAFNFSKLLSFIMEGKYKVFYIDGNDSIKKRNEIINQYIQCERAIICQAKVLNEGVNIEICDSVIPIDDIESSIDIIQFIGRMLRLHPTKKLAYMIIPMLTSKNEDIINERREYNNVRLLARAISYEDENISNYFKNFNITKHEKELNGNNNDDNNPIIIKNVNDIPDLDVTLRIIRDYNKIAPEIFEKAREIVHKLKFDSIKKYREWCDNRKEFLNIPKNPESVYKTLGWISWADWLNKKIMDKNEIKKMLMKENEKRRIKLDNMNDEEKILHFLKVRNDKKTLLEDINNLDLINKPKFVLNKLIKKKLIKYENSCLYNCNDMIFDFEIIDTIEKFDDWAIKNNIPEYDELRDFYDFKDPKWLLGLEEQKYPSWDVFQEICKQYYHQNINKYGNIVEYYNDLKLVYDLPNDPIIIYKKFEDYNSLFGA